MWLPARRGRSVAVVLAVAVLAGCASSVDEVATGVDIHMEQLPRSEFDVGSRGAISIAYLMTIRNRRSEPIALRSVNLKAVGRSPYLLRDTPAAFDAVTIPAGQESVVTLSMWAYPRGAKSSQVWLRGFAQFESGGASTFTVPIEQSFRAPD